MAVKENEIDTFYFFLPPGSKVFFVTIIIKERARISAKAKQATVPDKNKYLFSSLWKERQRGEEEYKNLKPSYFLQISEKL